MTCSPGFVKGGERMDRQRIVLSAVGLVLVAISAVLAFNGEVGLAWIPLIIALGIVLLNRRRA